MPDSPPHEPKRRRLALYFADPVDRGTEALRHGRRVVELMDPRGALRVGVAAADLTATTGAATRFRQTGLRAQVARALCRWVDLHRRTGAELLDDTRTDAPGRVARPNLDRPAHEALGCPAWVVAGTALERCRERPYDQAGDLEEDERDHRRALEALADAWVGWLRTARGVERAAACEERLALAVADGPGPGPALDDLFVRLGELTVTRHLVGLAWGAVWMLLSDPAAAAGVGRTALLWLGQITEDADEATARLATPSAAADLARRRRGL